MHVIGTAGHVDHGKSTLVQALTGINPDRLKEEQEREMTIDLGFAWLTLPSGESVSIVDMPGHEDFIRNMLAGVGGIDAALLVVAADEGAMPQTREHVAILDLLKVKNGLVALTKTDVVQDPEWLELVKTDVAALLADTSLSEAKIIPVSARTKQGLDDLITELERLLRETPTRRDLGRPRLPIDRVFSIVGFGTVVTGTLIDGRLCVGDEVEILPNGLKARVRGLQSHKTKIETAVPGSRVAANLTGVSTDQLVRGDVVTLPGWLVPTQLIDVRLDILADAPKPIRHNVKTEFFSGSAQIPARTRILGAEEIAPGESGWAQLLLERPAVLVKSDRFILRQPSPGVTIGGGVVIDPHPQRRHHRFRSEVTQRLEMLIHGSPAEVLLELLERDEPVEASALVRRSSLAQTVAEEALSHLLSKGMVVVLEVDSAGTDARAIIAGGRHLMSTAGWQRLLDEIVDLTGEYHRQYPLRVGIPREELKSRLRLDARLFNEVITWVARASHAVEAGAFVHLPGHEVKFTASQQAQVKRLLNAFRQNRYTPPSVGEAKSQVGDEAFNVLVEQGVLVKVSEDICFSDQTYHEIVERVVEHLKTHPSITVAQVRDMFGMSRKYVLPFLEHLDERRVTKRVGDERVLR